jgi:WD40 repeat protein
MMLPKNMKRSIISFSLLILIFSQVMTAEDGIPIAEVKRSEPVDFDREVLPLLRQNCLACHNSTDAEGDVVLESVAKILASEAVVAGKPDASSMLSLSAHQDDPVMPPEDNEVKAKNMTSQQLGLIKLWIAEGAKPSLNSTAGKIEFTKLPVGVNPVYSLAMSRDGRYLAAGRANQIFVYSLSGKRLLERVTDPELLKSSIYNQPGVAHLDLVQSIAFSPDNQTFVSGGFRTVKIWKKQPYNVSQSELKMAGPIVVSNASADNVWMVLGNDKGQLYVVDAANRSLKKELKTGDQSIEQVAVGTDSKQVALVTEKRKLRLFDLETSQQIGKEIALEQDATGLAIASENKQVLVALANNVIAVYEISAFSSEMPESAKPLRSMAGHSKPVTHLKPFGEKQVKLATAGMDGTAKVWDLTNGSQVRTFNHTGVISGLEVTSDGTRVATCGSNGSLKIWNGTNGALVKEVRGDLSVEFQISENDRLVRLKQKLIDAAKKDLDAGSKEKTAEEANVKKTEEALKKSEEETKKKLAAKTKAETDFATANKTFLAKKNELVGLQKQKTDAANMLKVDTEMAKAKTAALTEADSQLKAAMATQQEKTKAQGVKKQQLDKDPENEGLKKAVADGVSQLAEEQKKVAALNMARTQAENAKKAIDDKAAKTKIAADDTTKKVAAAEAEVKKQEPNIKKLTDANKKATDEFNAADRNQKLATNSVQRAKARSKTATERVPVLDAAHKKATEAKVLQEKEALAYKTTNEKALSALVDIAMLGNDSVAYWDANSNLGICSLETGEKSDVWKSSFPISKFNMPTRNRALLSIEPQSGKAFAVTLTDKWNLAKTIGDIDDVKVFSDRVTALDISKDGQFLATGSGEPSRSGEIKIWNLATGALVKEVVDAHSDTILDLSFSPDGTKIASSSSDRFMKTFDLSSGKLIRVFEGHTHHVMGVDWNSIGRELSTAGADKVIKIWDAETGTQKRTIAGYGKEVTSLAFVELTDQIITASGDKTVRMKNTTNGGEVRQFGGYADFVYSVAASADGKKLAAGGQDSVVRVWADNGKVFVEFKPPVE